MKWTKVRGRKPTLVVGRMAQGPAFTSFLYGHCERCGATAEGRSSTPAEHVASHGDAAREHDELSLTSKADREHAVACRGGRP